ncbi:MAG: DUF488 family protein [Candidatus Binatia bacterium]
MRWRSLSQSALSHPDPPPSRERKVYTIGHSTRSLQEFIELLRLSQIELLIDVRTVPRSRRFPHFNSEAPARTLREYAVHYRHLKELGGLRKPAPNSLNTGWRNLSFRGFADYMQSQVFRRGLEDALHCATKRRTVLVCAEAVPWRCHRSLIADALLLKQAEVLHIVSASDVRNHNLTPFAVIQENRLTYPQPGSML